MTDTDFGRRDFVPGKVAVITLQSYRTRLGRLLLVCIIVNHLTQEP